MTTLDQRTAALVDDPDFTPTTPDTPVSALDHIRAKRQELAERDHLVQILRVYDGTVAARYVYPAGGFTDLSSIGKRSAKSKDTLADLNALIDTMVTCCEALLAVDPKRPEDEWTSLDPSGAPVKFDRGLAALIGLEIPEQITARARFTVRHFYSPHFEHTNEFRGDPALVADAMELGQWLESTGREADAALPGES